MGQKARLVPYGFTAAPLSRPRNGAVPYNGEAVNFDTHLGLENWPSKGFLIDRIVVASATANKAGGRWTMHLADGTEHKIVYSNTSLYEDKDSEDAPTALSGASVTETFNPCFVNLQSPASIGVLFTGTDADCYGFRKVGSDIAAFLFNLAAPASVTLAQAAAGALADGTYYVAQQWRDETGATVAESEPTIQSIVVAAGGGTASIDVPAPATPPTRATERRIYLSSTTNSPSALLFIADTAVTGTYNIAALSSSIVTPTNRNGAYQTSVMPITNVRFAVEHRGRLFIASDKSNEVAFSERDAPNQFYATNKITAEADGGWNGVVRGLVSLNGVLYVLTAAGIVAVHGSFSRDVLGENPTYAADIAPPVFVSALACVSHGSIAVKDNTAYFMSDQGPAFLTGGGQTDLVLKDDISGYMRRLDWAYASRWSGTIDPVGSYYCVAVTRRTNSSRPCDGAATAGICDRILRFDIPHRIWACPLAIGDVTHISTGKGGTQGARTNQSFLYAASSMQRVLKLGIGRTGGGPLDSSGATYDGYLATAHSTTTATITLGGISNDALIGMLVALYYPSTDSTFPGIVAWRTISDNATSGSDLTITWVGALTVPSGTKWTVRIAGFVHWWDLRPDVRGLIEVPDPRSKVQLLGVSMSLHDVRGAEAVS